MKVFFSKRHEEAIINKKLRPSFTTKCRTSIERILDNYSEHGLYFFDDGGQDYNANITYYKIEETLKTFYGERVLRAFNPENKLAEASLSQVIINGYPSQVLDVIEAWFYHKPERLRECETELNDVLAIHDSPWRIINGEVILVDSEYLYREVQVKTINLLRENDIPGALEEYQGAISDLTSGETKDAVIKAHKSVESVMKAVLNTEEHHTFGKLLNELIKSQIIPEYYEEFLKHFEKLALGIVKERNLPARGHGQGRHSETVSPSLAEFAVNLAGSINIFITKHWIESRQVFYEDANELDADDSPF